MIGYSDGIYRQAPDCKPSIGRSLVGPSGAFIFAWRQIGHPDGLPLDSRLQAGDVK